MVDITSENKIDIVRSYCYRLLDDMDMDTLYSFAYSMLYDNKVEKSIEDLTKEIKDYYPDILET